MEDFSEQNTISEIKSSADFILELISMLRAEDYADKELVDILELHILKEKTSSNAVFDALQQIRRLAELRAKETSDVK